MLKELSSLLENKLSKDISTNKSNAMSIYNRSDYDSNDYRIENLLKNSNLSLYDERCDRKYSAGLSSSGCNPLVTCSPNLDLVNNSTPYNHPPPIENEIIINKTACGRNDMDRKSHSITDLAIDKTKVFSFYPEKQLAQYSKERSDDSLCKGAVPENFRMKEVIKGLKRSRKHYAQYNRESSDDNDCKGIISENVSKMKIIKDLKCSHQRTSRYFNPLVPKRYKKCCCGKLKKSFFLKFSHRRTRKRKCSICYKCKRIFERHKRSRSAFVYWSRAEDAEGVYPHEKHCDISRALSNFSSNEYDSRSSRSSEEEYVGRYLTPFPIINMTNPKNCTSITNEKPAERAIEGIITDANKLEAEPHEFINDNNVTNISSNAVDIGCTTVIASSDNDFNLLCTVDRSDTMGNNHDFCSSLYHIGNITLKNARVKLSNNSSVEVNIKAKEHHNMNVDFNTKTLLDDNSSLGPYKLSVQSAEETLKSSAPLVSKDTSKKETAGVEIVNDTGAAALPRIKNSNIFEGHNGKEKESIMTSKNIINETNNNCCYVRIDRCEDNNTQNEVRKGSNSSGFDNNSNGTSNNKIDMNRCEVISNHYSNEIAFDGNGEEHNVGSVDNKCYSINATVTKNDYDLAANIKAVKKENYSINDIRIDSTEKNDNDDFTGNNNDSIINSKVIKVLASPRKCLLSELNNEEPGNFSCNIYHVNGAPYTDCPQSITSSVVESGPVITISTLSVDNSNSLTILTNENQKVSFSSLQILEQSLLSTECEPYSQNTTQNTLINNEEQLKLSNSSPSFSSQFDIPISQQEVLLPSREPLSVQLGELLSCNSALVSISSPPKQLAEDFVNRLSVSTTEIEQFFSSKKELSNIAEFNKIGTTILFLY
ncbi:hypothetical protein Zmor_008811 [Zophobas morio]|uniref:Uncharacterized protein n=1 Tax=Zophobas morio TaxID=2755281 RepID=A0AA38LZK5_9CUCU|nr:hypothetical protein Zmor_008811 [Zophobas morio]